MAHSIFNSNYTIFFNGDLSGEMEWINRKNPEETHIIPEDVVRLIKMVCFQEFLNTLEENNEIFLK